MTPLDAAALATLFTEARTFTRWQQRPVPDGVIKQVIRGIFVSQLETLKRQLNITTTDASDNDDDP